MLLHPDTSESYRLARAALKEGKRVRRAGWNDESFWQMVDGRLRMSIGGNLTYCYPRDIERCADDWQVLD